jgi:hypothetical protein
MFRDGYLVPARRHQPRFENVTPGDPDQEAILRPRAEFTDRSLQELAAAGGGRG